MMTVFLNEFRPTVELDVTILVATYRLCRLCRCARPKMRLTATASTSFLLCLASNANVLLAFVQTMHRIDILVLHVR
jgi:hypothetical protein